MSRNKQEGRYAGKRLGGHFRSKLYRKPFSFAADLGYTHRLRIRSLFTGKGFDKVWIDELVETSIQKLLDMKVK